MHDETSELTDEVIVRAHAEHDGCRARHALGIVFDGNQQNRAIGIDDTGQRFRVIILRVGVVIPVRRLKYVANTVNIAKRCFADRDHR